MNLLTTTEAAKVLRMHPKTLERLRSTDNGPKFCKIPSTKPGPTYVYRYRKDDLRQFIIGTQGGEE